VALGDSNCEARGYALLVEAYLLMCQPVENVQAMQAGRKNEHIAYFTPRLENDILAFRPTVLTTYFGVPDYVMDDGAAMRFQTTLDGIVKAFKQGGVRQIVLGAPGMFGADPGHVQRLGRIAKATRQVAEDNSVDFVNVHELMTELEAKAEDGAQLNQLKSAETLIMAYAFLKALKCSGEIGTLTYDWKRDKATATPGHKVLSAGKGTLEVESSKYPFYLKGVSGIVPFNEELNRFVLMVKNAPAPRMEVTWGADSKTFTADELARGVNLSAEFPEHPLREPFLAVEEKIVEKQAFETVAVKDLLHDLPLWKEYVPELADTYRTLEESLLQKCADLRRQTRDAVKPVAHKLVIKPVN